MCKSSNKGVAHLVLKGNQKNNNSIRIYASLITQSNERKQFVLRGTHFCIILLLQPTELNSAKISHPLLHKRKSGIV